MKKAKNVQKKSVSKSTPKKPIEIKKTNSFGVTPLGDRVLIRPAREEEKTIGALIIPATGEREKPDQGTVLAVGEGKYVDGTLVPMRIKVGDTVMFSKYSYDELKVRGEDLYIIKEEHVLAVINK